MPTNSKWVKLDSHFDRYAADVDRAVTRTLGHSAATVVAVARGKGSPYRINSILSTIKAWPVIRTVHGWEVHVVSSDFREIFFELGTLGRRKRAIKGQRKLPTRTVGGKVRGIKPGYFLATGLKVAKARLLSDLKHEMPR
jgi:hypothetical protein